MSPVIRSGATGFVTSSTGFNVTETTANPQAGDIRVVFVNCTSSITVTFPSGWIVLTNGVVGTTTLAVAYKAWVAGVGSQTITTSTAATIGTEVMAIGDVGPGTPQFATAGSSSASATLTSASITSTVSDGLLLAYFSGTIASGATGSTLSNPSGMTSVHASPGNVSNSYVLRTSSALVTSTGATGSFTSTVGGTGSSTASSWRCVTLVIPSSGTSYSQTVGPDTAGATDSVSAVQGYAQTLTTDTAGATDSVSTAEAYGRSASDTAGAADTTGQVANYAPSITDAAGAADTFSPSLGAFQTFTDTAGAVDTPTQATTYSRSLSDAVGATDSTDEAWDQHFPLSDTAGATDSASVAQAHGRVLDDSISAADAVFDAVGHETQVVVPDDAIGVSDAATQTVTSSRPQSDAAGASDSLQTAEAEHSAITDPAGASDSVNWSSETARTVSDAAGAHDTTTYVVGHDQVRTINDAIGAHDSAPTKVISVTPPLPVTRAIETDSAFALGPSRATKPVTVAVDSQVARVIPPAQATKPVTIASQETDSAFALRPTGSYPTGIAVDIERALPLDDAVVDSDAWAEAIEAEDRVPIFGFRADWNRDGLFSHDLSDLTDVTQTVTVTRELAGELPAEVGLVEGYSAATLSATIAGQWPDQGIDPVQALAPYQPDSVFYGQPTIGVPIELDTGFQTREGRKSTRRFTGSISRINPSSAARDVQLNALDPANKLRAPITQAPVALDSVLFAKYGPLRYFARYNSQWLIDRILRANGIYASPPPQPGAFLSVTMHGSQIPEIGGGGVPEQFSPGSPNTDKAWVTSDHPFNMLHSNPVAPPPTGSWYADERLTMGAGQGIGWSGWVLMPSVPASGLIWGIVLNVNPYTDSSLYHTISFQILSGVPAMVIGTPTQGVQAISTSEYQLPPEPKWTFIGCHWQFVSGGVFMTLDIDGILYGNTTAYPLTITTSSWAPTTTVFYELDTPVTNMSWWKSYTPPLSDEWVGQTWIPQADIDPGLNELTAIPELAGEDSWALLTEVVGAEYGRAGFSLEGRFWFRSRAVARPRGEPERVTAQRELADMVTATDEAGVRNSITSAITPLMVGPYEWVVNSSDPELFQAGTGTSYFDVTLPPGVVIADAPYVTEFFTSDSWRTYSDSNAYASSLCCSAVNFFNPAQLIDPSAFSIGVFRKDAATITIAIYNLTGVTIIFKTPDVITDNGDGTTTRTVGEPAFKVPGRKLAEQGSAPQVIFDQGSIDLYGPRTYELGSNGSRWHQHPGAVSGIAEGVLGATGHPVPVLDAVIVRHDPRRDLEDPIVVSDPYGLGEVVGTIAGITTTYSGGDPTTDELTVRPLAPPGFGLWDDPDLGRIGHTLRFGP